MISTISWDRVLSNDFIAEELFEAIADIAAGNAKLNLNVFGIERIFAQIEQGMDLRDGSIHAPCTAQITPMEDKALNSFW